MASRWILSLVLLVAATAQARTLKPNDFAYGAELAVSGDSALVEATLTPEVYRALTRGDLGDLRVFNAAGEVVPHLLRLPPPPSMSRTVDRPPLFPVYANQGQTVDKVVMNVKHDAQGRIVRVETRRVSEGNRRIVAYIIDASAIQTPVAAFELEWSGLDTDFMGAVSLQTSDDLARWTNVVTDAGIASIKFGGEQLERRRIEFPPQQAKYYRIVWPPERPIPELPMVKFEGVARAATPERNWEKVVLHAGKEPGEYVFAAPGRFPADRVRVQLLPQANRVVQATLQSRAHPQDAWSQRGSGSVYRLKFGPLVLDSPELALAGMSGTEWMLRLTPAEGLENVEASLELGWVPHRLVFVASGNGPFRIAYGAVDVAPIEGQLSGVLADVEKGGPQTAVAVATLGSQVGLGGPDRLSASATANWRTWVLWAALLIAVALLGWMAWRLWRRMEAPSEPSN
jgi:hypothetical protein